MHTVRVGDSTCGVQREAQRDICETSGLEQHYGSLILLGVFVALLAWAVTFGAMVWNLWRLFQRPAARSGTYPTAG
jgi:hypothetical protein